MKALLTTLTLVFTVMFSSTSFGGRTKVGESVDGNTFYVDFDRIRKHKRYVYFWNLSDYLKPTGYGDLSDKKYRQGDCKLFRFMNLSYSFHKEPMGGGTGLVQKPNKESQGWRHPPPNSIDEILLKTVCQYAK